MKKVLVCQAVLRNFDDPVNPVPQTTPIDFHRWTDENFPPIADWPGRLQYRLPKTHAWQLKPGYDYYIWLDGAWTFGKEDSAQWYIDQLGDDDIAFFAHPSRTTVTQEVEHIEDHLNRNKPYITSRYKGGRHREFLEKYQREGYADDALYASTVFIYRDTQKVRQALAEWWYQGTLYYTCDQVQLPYVLKKYGVKVKTLDGHIYKSPHLTEASKHA